MFVAYVYGVCSWNIHICLKNNQLAVFPVDLLLT